VLIVYVVRILEARRIDDWTDLGYYCRRLQPSTSLPPIHGMQSTSQEVQGR
jgi:hypothetical protein